MRVNIPPAPDGFCETLWVESYTLAVATAQLCEKFGAVCTAEDVWFAARREYEELAAIRSLNTFGGEPCCALSATAEKAFSSALFS